MNNFIVIKYFILMFVHAKSLENVRVILILYSASALIEYDGVQDPKAYCDAPFVVLCWFGSQNRTSNRVLNHLKRETKSYKNMCG